MKPNLIKPVEPISLSDKRRQRELLDILRCFPPKTTIELFQQMVSEHFETVGQIVLAGKMFSDEQWRELWDKYREDEEDDECLS